MMNLVNYVERKKKIDCEMIVQGGDGCLLLQSPVLLWKRRGTGRVFLGKSPCQVSLDSSIEIS